MITIKFPSDSFKSYNLYSLPTIKLSKISCFIALIVRLSWLWYEITYSWDYPHPISQCLVLYHCWRFSFMIFGMLFMTYYEGLHHKQDISWVAHHNQLPLLQRKNSLRQPEVITSWIKSHFSGANTNLSKSLDKYIWRGSK